jgi:hypothetical protein
MNYKFNYSALDSRYLQAFDPKFESNRNSNSYKNTAISSDINRNYNKRQHPSNSALLTENHKHSFHRYNNSQENYTFLTKNNDFKEQVACSESVKNTIDKYDFKMNFDLLKFKIDRLNQLKEKEPIQGHRRK